MFAKAAYIVRETKWSVPDAPRQDHTSGWREEGMAWVSLHNLLDPNINLKGSVPLDATVRCSIPDPNEVELSAKSCLGLFKKQFRNQLEKMDGKVMTLAQFMNRYPSFAGDIEWIFNNHGKFVHFEDGLTNLKDMNKFLKGHGEKPVKMKKGQNYWTSMKICHLDLGDWLKQQPKERIMLIAQTFGYLRRSEDVVDEFVKRFSKE